MWPVDLDNYFRPITLLGFGCIGRIKRILKIMGNKTSITSLICIIDRQTGNSIAGSLKRLWQNTSLLSLSDNG